MPISLGLSTSVALRRRHGSPQVSHMCFAPYLPDLRASLPEQLWVNRSLPTLPRYTPHIRFLFVRLVLCYRLPPSRSLPPPTCRVASPSPVRADSGLSPHRHTCAAGRTKKMDRLQAVLLSVEWSAKCTVVSASCHRRPCRALQCSRCGKAHETSRRECRCRRLGRR